jgi:hypothetical protein
VAQAINLCLKIAREVRKTLPPDSIDGALGAAFWPIEARQQDGF